MQDNGATEGIKRHEVIAMLVIVAAWVTNMIYCVLGTKYLLLIVSGLLVPLGVLHGICLWFGFNWY